MISVISDLVVACLVTIRENLSSLLFRLSPRYWCSLNCAKTNPFLEKQFSQIWNIELHVLRLNSNEKSDCKSYRNCMKYSPFCKNETIGHLTNFKTRNHIIDKEDWWLTKHQRYSGFISIVVWYINGLQFSGCYESQHNGFNSR